MIKFATIGRGKIVDCFIEGAKLSDELQLNAVYSRSRNDGEAFAKKHGAKKVYTSLVDLAADPEIDAVYIASPNLFHAEQSKFLLNSGKHILCEKPIACSADEYKSVKELADKKGLIYMEAIIPIYSPFRKAVKSAVNNVGNISLVRLDYCQLSSRYSDFCSGVHTNIFDMSLHAGALMDLGVYCVYAAVDLFGVPKSITASASFPHNEADGSGSAIFEYDGFSVLLSYSKTGQSVTPSEIVGDKGSVTIGKLGLYADARIIKGGIETPLTCFTPKEELMSFEASAFARFIKGQDARDYRQNSQLCLNVHACLDAIKQSANIKYPEYKENK